MSGVKELSQEYRGLRSEVQRMSTLTDTGMIQGDINKLNIDAERKKNAGLRSQVEKLERDAAMLDGEFKAAFDAYTNLEDAHAELADKHSALERDLDDVAGYAADQESARIVAEDRVNVLLRKYGFAAGKFQRLQDQYDFVRSRFKGLERALGRELAANRANKRTIKELEETRDEAAHLKNELDAARVAYEQARHDLVYVEHANTEKGEELDRVKKRADNLEGELVDVEQGLDHVSAHATVQDAAVENYESLVDAAQDRINVLLRKYGFAAGKFQRLQQRYAALEIARDKLKSEFAAEHAALVVSEEQRSQLEANVEELNEWYVDARSTLATTVDERNALEQKKVAADAALKAVVNALPASVRARHGAQLAAPETAFPLLYRILRQTAKNAASARQVNGELGYELANAEVVIDRLKERSTKRAQQLHARIDELRATREELVRYQDAFVFVRQKYKDAKARKDRLELNVDVLRGRLQRTSDEVNDLETVVSARDAQIEQLGHVVDPVPESLVYAAARDAYTQFTKGSDREIQDCVRSTLAAVRGKRIAPTSVVELIKAFADFGSGVRKYASWIPGASSVLKKKFCHDVRAALLRVITNGGTRSVREIIDDVRMKTSNGLLPSEIARCYV